MIIRVSGSSTPSSVNLTIPQFVSFANTATSSSYAGTASFALSSLGSIESASYATYANAVSWSNVVNVPQNIVSSSQQASTWTVASAPVASDSVFGIYGIPPRAAATNFLWIYNNSGAFDRARYIVSPRGGASNQIDFYDIVTNRWLVGYFYSPLSETLTTGTSYAYDGENKLYIARGIAATTPIRMFEYDLNTNTTRGLMTTTILQGTPTIGNVLEIINSEDGLKYVYVLQNTGTQFTRGLVSW